MLQDDERERNHVFSQQPFSLHEGNFGTNLHLNLGLPDDHMTIIPQTDAHISRSAPLILPHLPYFTMLHFAHVEWALPLVPPCCRSVRRGSHLILKNLSNYCSLFPSAVYRLVNCPILRTFHMIHQCPIALYWIF